MNKVIALALIVFFGPLLHCAAAAQEFQKNWFPNKYVVVCKVPNNCILRESGRDLAEQLMPQVADTIKGMGFRAPKIWGKTALLDTPEEHVELYETDEGGIAGATLVKSSIGPERARIVIGDGIEQFTGAQHLPFYFMSHELFHLVSYDSLTTLEYSFDAKKRIPGWINEGTATAIGMEATRRNYPALFPPLKNIRFATNYSGLRRYYLPLPHRRKYETKGLDENIKIGEEAWTGDYESYRASSFWMHLAKVHYNGDYTFISRYLNTSVKNLDWVGWLKSQLERDSGLGLGTIFAGFLADYANWNAPGFPGALFESDYWLKTSFDGCQVVVLNKSKRHSSAEVSLLPLSGRCIEVHVEGAGESGLKSHESGSIQIAAEMLSGGSTDDLQLSLASANDHSQFNCAKALKKEGKGALRDCVFEPRKGGIDVPEATASGRVWNIKGGMGGERIVTFESGHRSELRQQLGPRQRKLVNRYIVSSTPENVSSGNTSEGSRKSAKYRLHFVLDIGEQRAEMGVGGGKFEVPNVDQPLPVEFDHILAELQRGQHREEGDSFIGVRDYEGLNEPCFMVFQFRNTKTNESLYFRIMQSGAFAPGEYEFASLVPHHRDTSYRIERQYPGMVLGSYTYLEQGGSTIGFSISAGLLRIESISGAYITGYVEAYGSHMKWSFERNQSEVLQQTALVARFSVDVSESFHYKYGKNKYSCLSSDSRHAKGSAGGRVLKSAAPSIPEATQEPSPRSTEPAEQPRPPVEAANPGSSGTVNDEEEALQKTAAKASTESEEELLRIRLVGYLEGKYPGEANRETRERSLKIFDNEPTLAGKKYLLQLSGIKF